MEKTFQLSAEGSACRSFREGLRPLLGKAGLDDKASGEVLLAVQEVLTNVIRHTYKGKGGAIEISYKDEANQVQITVRDYGDKFDITKVKEPELPRKEPGGLGVFLVKRLMDQVNYDASCLDGNRLHLIKYKTSAKHAKP
jgi:anti-sigma regulatory factor (Ser/Thr protein kinase)